MLTPRPAILALLAAMLASGCAAHFTPAGPSVETPAQAADAFVMADGTRLPYRTWMPDGHPWAVVLALHGMNDSRDAWELPAPAMAAAGIAVFAPDQRGFGATADRGYWPGAAALVSDAAAMAATLRARYPGARAFMMGESMGAAVLMALAASPARPPADGWVFIAPAVWGRAEQTPFERAALWLAFNTVPGLEVNGAPGIRIVASDNRDALRRLARDPMTLRATRVDAVEGLVDLMDTALAAAPAMPRHSLFLYGGHDDLVPKRATLAAWRALPGNGPERGYYPEGYHLLLRDKARAARIADVIAWMRDPAAPLPSGAEEAATAWVGAEDGSRLSPPRDSGYASR